MTMQELLIRVRDGGLSDAGSMAIFLKENGFKSGEHVGKDPDTFTPEMTIEWYLGQGIQIVESEAWFAMNSWLNCIEKFIPEDMTIDKHVRNIFSFDDELFEL